MATNYFFIIFMIFAFCSGRLDAQINISHSKLKITDHHFDDEGQNRAAGSLRAVYAEIDNINIVGLVPDNSISQTTIADLPNNLTFNGPLSFYDEPTSTINNVWNFQDFASDDAINVVGNITIENGAQLNINASHIIFDPNARIIVFPGGQLNITNSWLHSCELLWNGILLFPGATLSINNSYIEDAVNGVTSLNSQFNSDFQITNSFFNKNRNHLAVIGGFLGMAPVVHNGVFTGNELTSNDFTLPLDANEIGNLRSQIGIYIRNIDGINIGAIDQPSNLISDSYYGLVAINSSLNVVNNLFDQINCENYQINAFSCFSSLLNLHSPQPTPAINQLANPLLNQPIGASSAIYSVGSEIFNVNLNMDINSNIFNNCQHGILFRNLINVRIFDNQFSNISFTNNITMENLSNPFNTYTFLSGIGIGFTSNHRRLIRIRSNTFANTETITWGLNNYLSFIDIVSNISTSSMNNTYTGSWSGFRFHSDVPNLSSGLTIHGNIINDLNIGIGVSNHMNISPLFNYRITNNQILSNHQSGFAPNVGINIINSGSKSLINGNRVFSNTTEDFQPNTIGYNFNNSPGLTITCNAADNLRNSFAYFGQNSNCYMGANFMTNFHTGVNLRNAVIGAQGWGNTPRMNSWQGAFTRHFFAENNTNGALSNFVLNQWSTPNFDIIPNVISLNDFSPGASSITTNTISYAGPFNPEIAGCVAGFGLWEDDDFPVARYLDSSLVDFVLNDADTIYSEIYRRDAAMTFYRAYEADTDWAGVAGATALYDSLFTTDAGRICRAEAAYKRYPQLDTLGLDTLVKEQFEALLTALAASETVLDSVSTTEQPFAAYAEVMKLQIAKVTHEVSKMLYYSALDSLPYDSIVQLMNADSSYTFKFTTNQQRDLSLMAEETPQQSGNVVYIARAMTVNEENYANYYLNLNELPTNNIQLRVMNSEDSDEDNLVVNGSFEHLYSCPTNHSQLHKAIGWSNPAKGFGYFIQGGDSNPHGATPDLYALCSPINSGSNPSTYPNILVFPEDGENFAGIISSFNPFLPNSADSCYLREYIQGSLKQNLEQDKKYKVSFSIALTTMQCDQISNKLSLLFTPDSLMEDKDLCEYNPQVVTNTYFNRSDTWQLFETEYIANGSEKYFSMGFFLSNNTRLDLINNPNCDWPFNPSWELTYLIDNIKIKCIDPRGCDEVSTGEKINAQTLNIFPNPTSAQVNIVFSEPVNNIMSYNITDLQGRQMIQGNIVNQQTFLDVSIFAKGIYLLSIMDAHGNKWNRKVVVN